MKILFHIANGHKNSRIAYAVDADANMTRLRATQEFVDAVYAQWVRDELGNDFVIHEVTEDYFVFDFTYQDDADAFLRVHGGKPMEEA
jgi:hypothetical protein